MKKQKPTRTRGNYVPPTDEETQKKWESLRPTFLKIVITCSAGALAAFAYNRYGHPTETIAKVLVVAFQVGFAMAGCAFFLLLMALIFGRKKV